MKTLFLIIATTLLTGCVTASYTADDTSEQFSLTSLFKSVDGLDTSKGEGKFNLSMDKTHTQRPVQDMLMLMQFMQGAGMIVTPEQP